MTRKIKEEKPGARDASLRRQTCLELVVVVVSVIVVERSSRGEGAAGGVYPFRT